MKIFQKYAAEFLGTFILVGGGTGAALGLAIYEAQTYQAYGGLVLSQAALLTISVAFGVALMVALYSLGGTSGGHFNPAVSLAAFLDRRISIVDMAGYWVMQVAGALSASALLAWVFSRNAVGLSYPSPNPFMEISDLAGFFTEAVLTLVFVFAVLVLAKSQAHTKYIGMGVALMAVHFVGLFITGSGVNPARVLGPAVLSGSYGSIWIYMAGPLLGAIVAWALYKIVVEGDVRLGDDLVAMKDTVVADTKEAVEGVKEVF